MGARVTARAGRSRPRSVYARRRALRASLTAAAPALLPTYEMTIGGPADRYFQDAALSRQLNEHGSDHWPCESGALDTGGAVFRDGGEAVWQLNDGSVVLASLRGGWFHVHVASNDAATVASTCAAFRAQYPASYLSVDEDPKVPITFWAMGPHGPNARLRRIEASPWEPIANNYTAQVRDELDRLVSWRDGPDVDGQLLLWQGPPGTGKTWALRALASEWAPWAEFHYITDPDSFFVDHPSYMIEVLLADSYAAIEPSSGDVYDEQPAEGKWRILILEDTGELLAANAKEKYGQGLARLLNVVDGMIGQGLRVLCLVTTNDELGDLNPAVRRPGRCASQIVFDAFPPDEASAWLGEKVEEPLTVAELYARRGDAASALETERDHPDDPEPEDARDLMASAGQFGTGLSPVPGTDAVRACPDCGRRDQHAMTDGSWICESCGHVDSGSLTAGAVAAKTDKGKEIGAVAEQHAPDGGYGDTAWNEADGVVAWVSADWTTNEELDAAEAAFLAIDGVIQVDSEAEAALPEGDEWEIVYRSSALGPVEEDEEAVARVVELARRPLEPDPLVAAAATEDRYAALTERALDALSRPQPAPTFNMHFPAHPVAVNVEGSTIQVPPSETHVEAPVNVHLPEQAAQPAPHVDVHVPAATPAPVEVHVPAADPSPVHVHVAAPEPRRGAVRVEHDDQGRKVFVPVENEEEEEVVGDAATE